MKFLCACYYDAAQLAAMTPAEQQRMDEICAPHDKALRGSGHLIFVGSLGTPDQFKTLRAAGDQVKLEESPYASTKEPFGAFFMIDAADMDEAVKIASMHPGAHLGHMFGGGIEIRPVDYFEQV